MSHKIVKLYAKKATFIIASSIISSVSLAAEVTFSPVINLSILANDNVNLVSKKNAIDLVGGGANVSLEIARATERSNLKGLLRNNSTKYNEASYDSNDQYIDLSYLYNLEKGQFTTNLSYTHDTTRTSELTSTGEIGNERRDLYVLDVGYLHSFSMRSSANLGLSYSRQSYGVDDNSSLVGYKWLDSFLRYSYQLNEKISMFISSSVRRSASDERGTSVVSNLGNITQQYRYLNGSKGLSLGLEYRFSENLKSDFSVGRTRNDSDRELSSSTKTICENNTVFVLSGVRVIPSPLCYEDAENNSTITNLSYNLSWKRERSNFTASSKVQFLPNSYGQVDQVKGVGFKYAYRWTEKMNSSVAVDFTDRDLTVIDRFGVRKQGGLKYLNSYFQFGYKFTESMSINTAYSYYKRDDDRVIGTQDRNLVTVGFTYKPTKIFW